MSAVNHLKKKKTERDENIKKFIGKLVSLDSPIPPCRHDGKGASNSAPCVNNHTSFNVNRESRIKTSHMPTKGIQRSLIQASHLPSREIFDIESRDVEIHDVESTNPGGFFNSYIKDDVSSVSSASSIPPYIPKNGESGVSSKNKLTPADMTNTSADSKGKIPSSLQFRSSAKFLVRVPGAAKTRDEVDFFVETTKKDDVHPIVVVRSHEDFKWLKDMMKTEQNVAGIVFPPLPSSPKVAPSSVEQQFKIKIGSYSGYLIGAYEESCIAYSTFLNLCLAHPILGSMKVLENFLLIKEPPNIHQSLKFEVFGYIAKVVNDFRMMSFKDANQEFHAIFLHNPNLIKQAEDTLSKSQSVIEKKFALSDSYEELKKKLQLVIASEKGFTDLKRLVPMHQAITVARDVGDLRAANQQRVMSTVLKFYVKFIEAEQEMFEERVHKLMDLEHIRKSVEKSDTPQKQHDSVIFDRMKKEIDIMTEKAKDQMKIYEQQRTAVIKKALTFLAVNEINIARESIGVLKKIYADVQAKA